MATEYGYNEFHGIEIQAIVKRVDRRWTLWLIGGQWLERDIKAELDDGMAFIVDKDDGRTNGIYLVQAERGD